MNAYFFKMTKEERDNILDKHKSVYDGFVTQYVKPNQDPLYVQDYANDKGGLTVSNKGNITQYKNMNINEATFVPPKIGTSLETNEDIMSGAELEPEENIESEMYEQIEFFKEKFADYGRDRRSAIEFHLKNVARLLMPTSTTSVAIRALSGGMPNAGDVTQSQPSDRKSTRLNSSHRT